MKKKQEIGLSYVRELGMNTFRSYSSAHNHMVSKLGQDKTDELEQWFDSRCDKDLNSEKDFYEFKNSDFDLSMLVSEIFDAAYIRNMCNWFAKHKDILGKTILDIGCDCGIITCFIARICPNAQVTGIDRSINAIKNARMLAEKLGISNVCFEVADAELYTGQFDNVIVNRVTQENVEDVKCNMYDTFFNISDAFKQVIDKWYSSIIKLIQPKGKIVVAEMVGAEFFYYGALRSLISVGCFPIGLYRIKYGQFAETRNMCVVVATPDKELKQTVLANMPDGILEIKRNMLNAPYYKTREELWVKALYVSSLDDLDINRGDSQFVGWLANLYLDDTADELIEGYYVYTDEYDNPLMMSLWTNINDETALIHFGVSEIDPSIQAWANMDMSYKERMISSMHEEIERAYNSGHLIKVTKLEYKDAHFVEKEVTVKDITGVNISQNVLDSANSILEYMKTH